MTNLRSDKLTLWGEEIGAIQNFLGVNNAKMAQLLFIDKASLTNIYKRKTASRMISGIALERLAMELARPGSAKRMLDANTAMPEPESEITEKLNAIRCLEPSNHSYLAQPNQIQKKSDDFRLAIVIRIDGHDSRALVLRFVGIATALVAIAMKIAFIFSRAQ